MASRSLQVPLLLLLLAQLSSAAAASSSSCRSYNFLVFDLPSTTDGVVVATNSSMLAPATFLFDAQLFPEFNQSEGFVLISRPIAFWSADGNTGAREEASFNTTFTVDIEGGGSDAVSFVILLDSFPPLNSRNEKHGPRRATNGSVFSAVPNATNGVAAVEVGTVSSYGPRSPGVGLNVTITPNRSSSSTTEASQLAVRIEYDAAVHRLLVYVGAAGDQSRKRNSPVALLDVPLDLAVRVSTPAALVGFFADTVRDLVVGVRGWELTVDNLQDDDVGYGPQHQSDERSTSWWLVILLAVLGSAAAVGVAVFSVMVYLVVARRRAVDVEVQQCYRDYFRRMAH